MPSYPTNPFARTMNVHSWQVKYNDPLRNGTEEGKLHGTRFGPDCRLMGNVMADIRYTTFTLPGATEAIRTYADIEYPCADFWEPGARKPKPFLPGGFFYRSAGVIEQVPDDYAGELLIPDYVAYYDLGGYGGPTTKGQDVLGPPKAIIRYKSDGTPVSVYADPNQTTPLWPGKFEDETYSGILDSVIILLAPCTTGEISRKMRGYELDELDTSHTDSDE